VADGSVDEMVRLAVEVVVGAVGLAVALAVGVEKPEHAFNKSSANRIVIRAVH
jgi:hypothetical protein